MEVQEAILQPKRALNEIDIIEGRVKKYREKSGLLRHL